MRLGKSARLIAFTVAWVALLALPLIYDMFYTAFYYVGCMAMLPFLILRIIRDEKFEGKFYKRWGRLREKGFWFNVMRLGFCSFVFITLAVCLSQFFARGLTPLEIVSELSGTALTWISLLLLGFSAMIGVAAWYENEKRYRRNGMLRKQFDS